MKRKGFIISVSALAAITLIFCALAFNLKKDERNVEPRLDVLNDSVSAELSPEEMSGLISFDEQAWEGFEKMYVAHNDISNGLELYKEGKMTKDLLMGYCDAMIDYLGQTVEIPEKLEGREFEYLAKLKGYYAANILAARKTSDYLNSDSREDLEEAERAFSSAKISSDAIAEDRQKFLAQVGVTPTDAMKITDDDFARLNDIVLNGAAV
jgi:hypothetical protein